MKLSDLNERVITVSISDIIMSRDGLSMAYYDNKSEHAGKTIGPIGIARIGRKWKLIDGYHRMVKHLEHGRNQVQAIVVPDVLSPVNDKFNYRSNLPCRGLEDIVELPNT